MNPGLLEASLAPDEKGNASRYHFRESEGASLLVIEGGADRTPVSIIHEGVRFRVVALEQDGPHYHGSTATGLFDYYKLSRLVAQGLMSSWQGVPREMRCSPKGVRGLHQRLLEERHATYPVPNAVREWAETQTAKAIGGRLHAWYKDRLASPQTPPVVREVQRRAFAATFTAPIPLLHEDFYDRADPLLLDDLSKYRACAVALLNASAGTRVFSRIRAHHGVRELTSSREYAELVALASRFGVEVVLGRGHPRALVRAEGERGLEGVVRVMQGGSHGWRGLFSPDGETYRSLDRTLMNLPGGLSPAIVPYLAMVRLGRPLLTRLELAFVCLYGQGLYDRYARGRDPLPPMPDDALDVEAAQANEAVFLNARADRIKRAVRLVSEHTRNPLSPRRTTDLAFAVRFLMDYPEEHRGNIVGLAEKSIAWHRTAARREAEKMVASLGGKREAARPPIPPPDDERIAFLSTVEEIVEEGQRMNNCIASYVQRAVRGDSLLFHVEKDGEGTTIEVSPHGYVVQAAGAHNRRNKAARWAGRVLGRWAKEFPRQESPEADADDIPF